MEWLWPAAAAATTTTTSTTAAHAACEGASSGPALQSLPRPSYRTSLCTISTIRSHQVRCRPSICHRSIPSTDDCSNRETFFSLWYILEAPIFHILKKGRQEKVEASSRTGGSGFNCPCTQMRAPSLLACLSGLALNRFIQAVEKGEGLDQEAENKDALYPLPLLLRCSIQMS